MRADAVPNSRSRPGGTLPGASITSAVMTSRPRWARSSGGTGVAGQLLGSAIALKIVQAM